MIRRWIDRTLARMDKDPDANPRAVALMLWLDGVWP